jgi:hypothetical protein
MNSLRSLGFTFAGAGLKDVGVLLEYLLPFTSKRLDCILCGYDLKGFPSAVVIELKQWRTGKRADGPYELVSFVGGSEKRIEGQVRQSAICELSGMLVVG